MMTCRQSRPLVVDLEIWMRQQLSASNDTAKAINYLLNRWASFTRFLDDGRVCLSNNAAERGLRQLVGVAYGRDTPAKGGGLCAVAGLSRQEGRHCLRACRQSENTLGLAPRLEQPEVP
jgi:hypothetical protein